ncbi:MAG: DUF922 domain-containing protein, partial [Anaerolineales bacterium]
GSVPQDAVDRWVIYMNDIIAHEKGHVNIVVTKMPDLYNAIRNSDCRNADMDARQIVAEIDHMNKQYDFENGISEFPT